MTDARLADVLRDLAAGVQRLSPCWSDPEKFHERKSEIIDQLRRLARDAEAGR